MYSYLTSYVQSVQMFKKYNLQFSLIACVVLVYSKYREKKQEIEVHNFTFQK